MATSGSAQTRRRSFVLHLMMCLAVLALIGLTASAALADTAAPAKPQPAPVTISLIAQAQKDGKVVLTAKATTATGAAVPDVKVDFAVMTDFLGKRTMAVASGKTDTTGAALASYVPTWDGAHHFQATFAGNDAFAAANASVDIDLPSITAPYKTAPAELASFRSKVGLAALTVTLVVWLLLITVAVRVMAGMAGARKKDPIGAGGAAAD